MIMFDRHRTSATLRDPCAEVPELAHARLDGELAAADAARLDAHLAACPPCAWAVALELRFARIVRARAGQDMLPPEARARLVASVTARPTARPTGRPGERPRAPRGTGA